MPGSEVVLALVTLVFVAGSLTFALLAWWIMRVALWSILRVNLRLADQVRDANSCVAALATKPGSVEYAFEREATDRAVHTMEAENGVMPFEATQPVRPPRRAMPTT